jgi:hypothetical protein
MPTWRTLQDERRELGSPLSLAVMLYDRVSGENRLFGLYDSREEEEADELELAAGGPRIQAHTTVRLAGLPVIPLRTSADARFLFFDLANGPFTVLIRSPFYRSADVSLTVPATTATWPVFPDVMLANPALPLEDPAQPQAYRDQRASATLQPSVKYPFPEAATLIRGTVRFQGNPLALAQVSASGQTYVTDNDGQFVFFMRNVTPAGQSVTVQATHPQHGPANTTVTCRRGLTVIADITMV